MRIFKPPEKSQEIVKPSSYKCFFLTESCKPHVRKQRGIIKTTTYSKFSKKLCSKFKNSIFFLMFSVTKCQLCYHNQYIISLSRHEQACLMRLRFEILRSWWEKHLPKRALGVLIFAPIIFCGFRSFLRIIILIILIYEI